MGSLPFTLEQFLDVFKNYNLSVWPTQIVLTLLAIVILVLVFIKARIASQAINFILGLFWLWIGIVYHFIFFSEINGAAYVFGSLFILQGLIFLYFALLQPGRLVYRYRPNFITLLGMLFILYALVVYPFLGDSFGHVYPAKPTFGLPCPITIFTFGILLLSIRKIPWYIIAIPFIWSLIGFSAAMNLGIKEDFGLVVAGILGAVLLLLRKKKISIQQQEGFLNPTIKHS